MTTDREIRAQERRDTRLADAWLAAFRASDPKRVEAVFAKHAVLTEEQDRQLRRDARLPADTVEYDTIHDEGGVDDSEDGETWHPPLNIAAVPWIPTATATEILRRKRLVSDKDLLRRFLITGSQREAAVKAQFPNWSDRQLKTAKADIGAKSRRRGFGPGSYVVWELP
jgi:hypothetical protein